MCCIVLFYVVFCSDAVLCLPLCTCLPGNVNEKSNTEERWKKGNNGTISTLSTTRDRGGQTCFLCGLQSGVYLPSPPPAETRMINPLYQCLHDCPPPPPRPYGRMSLHHPIILPPPREFLPSSTGNAYQALNASTLPSTTSTTTTRDHDPRLQYLMLERDKIRGTSRSIPFTTIGHQDHLPHASYHLTPTDAPRLPSVQGYLKKELKEAPCVPHCQGHALPGIFVKSAEIDNLTPHRETWVESVSASATSSRPQRRNLARVPSLQSQMVSLPAEYSTHSLSHSSFRRPIALPPPHYRDDDNQELSPASARHLVSCEGAGGWGWRGDVLGAPHDTYPLNKVAKRDRGDPRDSYMSDFGQDLIWNDEGEECYWTPSEGSEGSFISWSDGSEESPLEYSWNEGNDGFFLESQWSVESLHEAKWSEGTFLEARWSEGYEGASHATSLSDSGIDGDIDPREGTERQRGNNEEGIGDEGGIKEDNQDNGVAYRWLSSFWSLEIGSSGGKNLVVTASRSLGRYLRKQRSASPLRHPDSPLRPQVRLPTPEVIEARLLLLIVVVMVVVIVVLVVVVLVEVVRVDEMSVEVLTSNVSGGECGGSGCGGDMNLDNVRKYPQGQHTKHAINK